jgi:RimJ/RimL family protein N-acetyltransferase
MQKWLADDMSGADPLAFVVWHNARAVGMLAIMAIVPAHGRAEIGHVWMSPDVHRSGVNTQAQFLVLKYLLDELKYRRVEWKCNARNAASRAAAHRMGFVFEGRFRQHMVVKGESRDTDWFSLTDKDWPRARASFEAWIESGGTLSLSELNHGV